MNKLFSVFVAVFGFATVTSAQVNMPVPGAGPIITEIDENWDGVVAVKFTSDYFPVTLVVNGDTAVVEQVEYIGVYTFEVEPVRGANNYDRTYNVYASSIRGAMDRTKRFSDVKMLKGEDAFFHGRKKYSSHEAPVRQVPVETLRDESVEVIVQDYRKPVPIQGVPNVEELGNDADFDTLDYEYPYTKEYDMLPQFVESIDAEGKVFSRNIKPFQTGFRLGDEAGVIFVGTILRATPFYVEPGKDEYRLDLIMRDGKHRPSGLTRLTDVPEPL